MRLTSRPDYTRSHVAPTALRCCHERLQRSATATPLHCFSSGAVVTIRQSTRVARLSMREVPLAEMRARA